MRKHIDRFLRDPAGRKFWQQTSFLCLFGLSVLFLEQGGFVAFSAIAAYTGARALGQGTDKLSFNIRSEEQSTAQAMTAGVILREKILDICSLFIVTSLCFFVGSALYLIASLSGNFWDDYFNIALLRGSEALWMLVYGGIFYFSGVSFSQFSRTWFWAGLEAFFVPYIVWTGLALVLGLNAGCFLLVIAVFGLFSLRAREGRRFLLGITIRLFLGAWIAVHSLRFFNSTYSNHLSSALLPGHTRMNAGRIHRIHPSLQSGGQDEWVAYLFLTVACLPLLGVLYLTARGALKSALDLAANGPPVATERKLSS